MTVGTVSSSDDARGEDLDALRLAAWRTVRVLTDSVVARISHELESATGMPLEWYEILLHIRESGDGCLPQHELDKRSSLSQSGISRMVSKMEKANLIRREQASHDRRLVMVGLTPLGQDTFLRATPIYHMAVQQFFGSKFTDEEAEQINTGLSKVNQSASTVAGNSDDGALDQVITFGQSVLSVTSESVMVRDAVQIRDALEPLILLDASQHITQETIGLLHADVTRMSTLIDQPVDFFHADWELHRHIAACATNQLLREVYLRLLDILASHVTDVVPTTNLTPYLYERLAIHGRLVEAVASRDADKVRAAAEGHHFTGSQSRLVDGASSS